MPSGSESPGDDYFNDLSQQPADRNKGSTQRPRKDSGEPDAGGDNNNVNKQKRIACVVCRKRKLRCDGEKPSCGTCKRLAHDCAYDEVRRKSGPKRGYVKALEARLGMRIMLPSRMQFRRQRLTPPSCYSSSGDASQGPERRWHKQRWTQSRISRFCWFYDTSARLEHGT